MEESIEARLERLEQQQEELRRRNNRLKHALGQLTPDEITRRDAIRAGLLAGGAAGVGGVLGDQARRRAIGRAAAFAGTNDADGDIGDPNDRSDLFADGVDANSLTGQITGGADLTDLLGSNLEIASGALRVPPDLPDVDSLTGALTGGATLDTLAGNNLSISGGQLDASGAQPNVEDDGSQIVSGASVLDFQDNLSVTNPSGTEAEISAKSNPDWTEDGNSPATASAANSITYTLSGTYDFVTVFVKAADQAASGNPSEVQIDGDTGNNYDYVTYGGSETTGSDSIKDVVPGNSNGTDYGRFTLSGRSGNQATLTVLQGHSTANRTQAGRYNSFDGVLDSFTLLRGASTDWTVEVYGRSA